MKRILIADDEETIRKCLGLILQRQGYEVTQTKDGKQAYDLIRSAHKASAPFHLLITDIRMPRMTGFELIDKLREEEIDIPAIIITGQDDRAVVLEALRKGCHEFIDKPIIHNDIIEKIESTFIKIGKQSEKIRVKRKVDINSEGETHSQKLRKRQTFATTKLEVEKTIGNYKLIRVLGAGAIGTVFLCEHRHDKNKYAMKILRMDFHEDDRKKMLIKRFINESNAISQINHPNIVNFIEFGYTRTEQNCPYIVMEYFRGEPLKRYLQDPGKLSLSDKISIVYQLANALDAVHNKNILHRDIKPDNILVNKNLHVKITDFGICHLPTSDLTKTSDLMGSPGYMAPEYFKYSEASTQVDIYALGVVAYELFVGIRPFDADSLGELMNKIIKEYPAEPKKIVPDLPEPIQEILAKMLKKNPKKRYRKASEIIADISGIKEFKPQKSLLSIFKNMSIGKDWD